MWNTRNLNRLNWKVLLRDVLVIHLAIIGTLELIYRLVTGHYSVLLAGFGLVAAVLVSIRTVGESVYRPPVLKAKATDWQRV